MDRRTFIKTFTGTITSLTLPVSLQAKSPLGNHASFLTALEEKPWLLGYLGTRQTEPQADLHMISGSVPHDLKGYFYRNGPALHTIGLDRFSHWLDAPGMLQRFTFANNTVTHLGRMVETTRNVAEVNAGNILFSAFGTKGENLGSGGSADAQNVGNISIIKHAGELLALWEGGSAHVINQKNLKTDGIKAWSPETVGLPFGAHPRTDKDGSLWNIGYSADPSALIIYHISSTGELLQTHIIQQAATPMIHDFMITETKLVIVAPPYNANNLNGEAFIELFEWHDTHSTQILVIDKDDFTQVSTFEIDPFWVFHFGNAYDINDSEIGFDFAHYDDPTFMTHDSFAFMDGTWEGDISSASRYAQVFLNLTTKTACLKTVDGLGRTEFIQTDYRQNLANHRYALMLSSIETTEAYGFNRLLLVDRNSGKDVFFEVSKTEILEEHLIVPKPRTEDDFWIIGTSLDWAKGVTNLSVYEGRQLSDGPIMKAELDLALPLGLHGHFVPH